MARRRTKGLFARARRYSRWALRLLLVFLVIDLGYLAVTWPDWKQYRSGPVPKTNFIRDYEAQRATRQWPPLRWQPVPLSTIPPHLIRAVLLAEDIRFYTHSGFDLIAIKDALDYNLEQGRLVFGASTISQQTTKNLFLSASRNPLRKWHEVVLTVGLERHLSKERILEIYLNTAEFGRGVYGVQAASYAYWGIPVSQLDLTQAAELAATLPGPVKNNPHTRSGYFERHSERILKRLLRDYAPADAAAGPAPADDVAPPVTAEPAPAEGPPPVAAPDAAPPPAEPPAPAAG